MVSSFTCLFFAVVLVSSITASDAFVVPSKTSPSSTSARLLVTTAEPSRIRSKSSKLQMIVGPKQALMMEKRKNPAKFEETIQGLIKRNKLTRPQAEKRYGEFPLDPDGFALNAAARERQAKGYKDWKEQAIARSDDPEATAKRIASFQLLNSLKGTAIIIVFFGAVIAFNTMNPL